MIKWTHADGEVMEYADLGALAKALGIEWASAYKFYVTRGYRSDKEIENAGEPSKLKPGRKGIIRSLEERRAYWREQQAKYRDKLNPNRARRRKGKTSKQAIMRNAFERLHIDYDGFISSMLSDFEEGEQ